MALDAADWTVAVNGDIRWTGAGTATNVTVLEFHRWLQGLADDAVASGDDLHDITDTTSSERATDNIITLNSPYNIDDTAAEHIYNGSITQASGDTVYSGLVVVGSVVAGTELQIVQDNKILKNYWGSGLNTDAANNILLRIMVKTRVFGADIDGQKLRVQARELGDTYAEFSLTAGVGNSTAAIFTGSDLNNATAVGTIQTWDQFTNTEGFQLIDITGDGTDEEYYAQWTITGGGSTPATPTVNDLYEWTKMVGARPAPADSVVATGTNYIVDNGTITSMAVGATALTFTGGQKLTSVRMRLKNNAGTPTGYARVTVWDDSTGPNAIVATSRLIPVNILTSTYQELEFVFDDNVTLTSAGTYYVAIENVDATGTAVGSAGNNIHAEGDATDTNRYTYTAGWSAAVAGDLWFEMYTVPIIHGIDGLRFRGITHEIHYDTLTGTFTEDNHLVWGTRFQWDTPLATPGTVGEYYDFSISGAVGKLIALDDDTTDGSAVFIIEDGTTIVDNDVVTRADGTAADGFTVDTNAGADPVVGNGNVGGEGLLLAVRTGTTDRVWIQLLTGSAPANNYEIWNATTAGVFDQDLGANALVNVTITSRTISPEFIGTSTGSALIGAYGIAIDTTDTTASDQFFDLGNVLRVPPNNVTFTVSGLESGEDRVLVGPELAGALDVAQLSNDVLLNTAKAGADWSLQVTEAEPDNTPSTGTIRVVDNNGVHRLLFYNAVTAGAPAVFTIDHTLTDNAQEDFSSVNANVGNDVYITYIDELASGATAAVTTVFDSVDTFFVRVRDGGGTPIKTFETTSALNSGGGTATAIRTSDA